MKTDSLASACYDCSHWGRILLRGADRLRFLHNQSSNHLNLLKPGQGCDTVILTSTARTLDLVTAWVRSDDILLLVSPQRREPLQKWLDKYIFFGDQVELQDITPTTSCWRFLGTDCEQIFRNLGLDLSDLQQLGDHRQYHIADCPVEISFGSGLALPGLTLTVPIEYRLPVMAQIKLAQPELMELSETDWEHLRILQGRPAVDAELTEDYNPLEARLDYTISLDKGCYIGQETIARLNTYQGVKQQLWGLALTDDVEPGTPLRLEGTKVGVLTSCTSLDHPLDHQSKAFGLGYIKTKAGGVGLQVEAGTTMGQVVDVPFLGAARA
ncbi:folate-binding protein YgfZ [Synechococcus sp. PCC 6312]|uniref:CAF17-like 4Fe-4S cluster assembly/insertion protein YgfZ n=1 Tax=Synechococcus sp. (strain ATCC 27167 / PCC 6312) TaxID=195253 RepID=UPI00029F255F|nr:folate-binding protein YgfZ [Synechococcus sp. PCC 6312]AFY62166.1 folate-binding protein YgfZ [Synechococcus sp. PCC 6312]